MAIHKRNEQNFSKAYAVLKDHYLSFIPHKRDTPDRRLLLDIIYTSKSHVTIHDIKKKMKARKDELVSDFRPKESQKKETTKSSIYNSLALFVDLDLVSVVRQKRGTPSFYSPTIGERIKMAVRCMDCNKITVYEDLALEKLYGHLESGNVRKVINNSITIPTRCVTRKEEGGCEHENNKNG